MEKILILKMGTTYPAIREVYGDFEDFIIRQADLACLDVEVVSVYEGAKIPGIEDVSGIIITGSHSMVTERADWSEYTADWLRAAGTKNIPTLGICYGHQLIAQAYGGIVDYHPKGDEVGLAEIELTEDGKSDLLLGILPLVFKGYVSHSQTALKLPEGALILAKNGFEPHHAFRLNQNIWCVQFHPEFNAEISRMYIDIEKEYLSKAGYDMDVLHTSINESAYGKILLKRFVRLTAGE